MGMQDPAYPVYVDSSVIMGMTGNYNPESVGFDGMEYMPCSPANSFFPDLAKVPHEPPPCAHACNLHRVSAGTAPARFPRTTRSFRGLSAAAAARNCTAFTVLTHPL